LGDPDPEAEPFRGIGTDTGGEGVVCDFGSKKLMDAVIEEERGIGCRGGDTTGPGPDGRLDAEGEEVWFASTILFYSSFLSLRGVYGHWPSGKILDHESIC